MLFASTFVGEFQVQAAAVRLSPAIIRERLDYWTLILGPKFSHRERQQMKLHRFYAIVPRPSRYAHHPRRWL